MMLKPQDKKQLRKKHRAIVLYFRSEKEGVSENLIATLDDSLTAHELVKTESFKNSTTGNKRSCRIACGSDGQ